MRMVNVDYESLDLFVRFDTDNSEPEGIYAFAGRDKNGQDKFTYLGGVFSESSKREILAIAMDNLKEILQDEAEEERFVAETCHDTPFA